MQDHISSTNEQNFPDVVVQYYSNLDSVGIGLKKTTDVPTKHFLDDLYGDVPTQSEIGRMFIENLLHSQLTSEHYPLGFKVLLDEKLTPEQESAWHNEVGRAILNAITDSTEDNGWWTWVDRASINRMIRILRKARDTTFGRDE